MPESWTDRVVLITGGAGGIGAAAVRRFAGLGARVVLADLDAERGAKIAAGTGSVFVPADVSTLADNARLVDAALDRFGRLDMVWCNAGVLFGGAIGPDFDAAAYRRLVAINVDSVVFGVQAALPALRETGGSVLVTASTTGLRPGGDVFYSASKHAVVGLVRSLGPALAADGVRINVLCPGAVDTPLIAGRLAAWRAAGVAVAEPDLVADAALTVLADGGTGRAWVVLEDSGVAPFEFADIVVEGEKRVVLPQARGSDPV
ncbi:dehydrogenase [Streptomyces griseocarneus]|nr:dehydrogenase [Streptomyces griseocarneus]